MTEWLIVGCGTTIALLVIGHWFPWIERLKRLEAYVYGVASIIAGVAVACIGTGDWWPLWQLLAICLAGGVSVFGAYGWDAVRLYRAKARKAERLRREED